THATAHSDASSLLPSKLSPVIATFLSRHLCTIAFETCRENFLQIGARGGQSAATALSSPIRSQ
ncbi:hypothetical protein, partial [Ensifer soli]|uniref:hypothetical protein n=1 Tax=Ciceribacter sp. sgz301302 TaxID=3342379 RepID=UPI0035B70AA0